MARFLGGSDVGFGVPGLSMFVGLNLTSDKETGLGKWSARQIVTAITAGEQPDGRIVAPSVPWRGLADLTKADALAIAAYLQSLPPIRNKVAGGSARINNQVFSSCRSSQELPMQARIPDSAG